MKTTNIILKTITLLLTLQIYTLHPIDLPWYQHLCNKGNGIMYRDNCNNISIIQNIRCIALTAYYRLTNKKINLDKVLTSIETELIDIEEWIFTLEQEALLAIKEKYQISNEIWQKYGADLHRMKTIYSQNMMKSNPAIIHDPNVPADILETLTTLLQQNDINPHSVHITMVSDVTEADAHPNALAQAKSMVSFTISDASDQNFISYTYEPSTIEIFPFMMSDRSITNIMSTCAHEIQHLIQHHVLTRSILMIYLNHYYNVQDDEFKKTPEFHKLSQIYEAQAEILSATKDPKIAECLKMKRQQFFYPEHLYEDHFYHLAYINSLWKIHGWLEYFHR